jgi:hypothetical protein
MARTPRELGECIVLERVDAAEGPQPLRVLGRLGAGPVVFGTDPGVFVRDRARRAAVQVRNREHERAAHAGGIE